jgi:hypothetical protein
MIRTKPTGADRLTLSELEVFSSRIRRDENECWNWTGVITTTGYGEYWNRLKNIRALTHRVALELIYGSIVGIIPDHQCENTACCNPAHMSLGDQKANVLRGRSPQALNARLTHCLRGHEFTPENTYNRPGKKWRECAACAQLRELKRNKPSLEVQNVALPSHNKRNTHDHQ